MIFDAFSFDLPRTHYFFGEDMLSHHHNSNAWNRPGTKSDRISSRIMINLVFRLSIICLLRRCLEMGRTHSVCVYECVCVCGRRQTSLWYCVLDLGHAHAVRAWVVKSVAFDTNFGRRCAFRHLPTSWVMRYAQLPFKGGFILSSRSSWW